jgi:hypothetical protein
MTSGRRAAAKVAWAYIMHHTARSFGPLKDLCLALVASLASSGCYAYHITGNRVPPATEARSQTQVAYLWGIMQPNDIVPPNCPTNVPLSCNRTISFRPIVPPMCRSPM